MISGDDPTVDLDGRDPDQGRGRGREPDQANLARRECQVDGATEGQKWTQCTAGSAEGPGDMENVITCVGAGIHVV